MYNISILDNPDTFFLNWWKQYNDREVSSRELLPIATRDQGFIEHHVEHNDQARLNAIGLLLHNLSRSGRRCGVFSVLKERRKAYRLIKKTAALSMDPPEENPFGWLPSPKEFPVLTLIEKMVALGCTRKAVARALNEDARLFRGKPWTESLVEKVLTFTHEHEEFVFRSSGAGPKVEAHEEGTFNFYMESPQWGRVILRHDAQRQVSKLACEKDGWVWRPVYRDGRVEGFETPAAFQLWLCSCSQIWKGASPHEIAGVLDGLVRRVVDSSVKIKQSSRILSKSTLEKDP